MQGTGNAKPARRKIPVSHSPVSLHPPYSNRQRIKPENFPSAASKNPPKTPQLRENGDNKAGNSKYQDWITSPQSIPGVEDYKNPAQKRRQDCVYWRQSGWRREGLLSALRGSGDAKFWVFGHMGVRRMVALLSVRRFGLVLNERWFLALCLVYYHRTTPGIYIYLDKIPQTPGRLPFSFWGTLKKHLIT